MRLHGNEPCGAPPNETPSFARSRSILIRHRTPSIQQELGEKPEFLAGTNVVFLQVMKAPCLHTARGVSHTADPHSVPVYRRPSGTEDRRQHLEPNLLRLHCAIQ
jgi:hypothetical protein